MSGDLILHYEEIARQEGDVGGGFTTFDAGIYAIMRRIQRSVDPDGAALAEAEDAIEEFSAREHAEEILIAVARALPVCESPIEKVLLPWLVAQRYGAFNYAPRVLFAGEGRWLPDLGLAVMPQLPLGQYRADLAIVGRHGPFMKCVVIECDGKEFHDSEFHRARDAKRDAYLRSRADVLEVVRFTGTEIYRSPRECARQAAAIVARCWCKTNKALDHKFAAVAP